MPPTTRRSSRAKSSENPSSQQQQQLSSEDPNTVLVTSGNSISEGCLSGNKSKPSRKRAKKDDGTTTTTTTAASKKMKVKVVDPECRFVGEPIPMDEARKIWPERYEPRKTPPKGNGSRSKRSKKKNDEEEAPRLARCHYREAEIDGTIFYLNDTAYIKGEGDNYIGQIVELFETDENDPYFTAKWFYRAEDTVIKDHAHLIDKKRVFVSHVKNDNPLNCILSKLKIVQVAADVSKSFKEAIIHDCDYYYDMLYSIPYTTFSNIPEGPGHATAANDTLSTSSKAIVPDGRNEKELDSEESSLTNESEKPSMSLLDIYSGCGAMSTGLCLGANKSGVSLVTRWAVDLNKCACESLKLNHPETEVRNETAESFFYLLREWEQLCKKFSMLGTKTEHSQAYNSQPDVEDNEIVSEVSSKEFEVGKLVGISYGHPNNIKKVGLHFKVRWKGYGPTEDTWEPITGLSKCEERIQDFVTRGYSSNILPLPGDVDVICGGPPCQGISGYNRFRNKDAPLDDPKNRQLVVFMDIVEYLKPRYVLMENVVDIMRFAGGYLGRYVMSRIVSMNYQARLGMMVAGCYGLPQFRMRVFIWGARPSEKLPQYPLPTHEVRVRGSAPKEFEQNIVAYAENEDPRLERALLLGDAISDLPPVTNNETHDEMHYGRAAQTEFQRFIRLSKHEVMESKFTIKKASGEPMLFDHLPLKLSDDDYQRVCSIPKVKGANFRNLKGVHIRPDNKVELDESMERVILSSGKPLVPDYALSYIGGTSSKPFGRLWWDETVPTVVTRAEPHNQVILHPEQDRVLSVRENARLQGFPDCYKLCGSVKDRYVQVGNAVAVPVACALGYSLGLAYKGFSNDNPLLDLPDSLFRI